MLPDRVSNPGSLTYESSALPIALRSPAQAYGIRKTICMRIGKDTSVTAITFQNRNKYNC